MNRIKQFSLMLLMMLITYSAWGTTVSIPQTLGQYIDWNNATITNCKVENNGANIGSTGSKTVVTFTLSNSTEQDFYLTMKSGAKGLTAVITVSIKNGETVLFTQDCNVENTGSWTPSTEHRLLLGTLPQSNNLTLEIKVKSTTGSYAGNYGALALYGSTQYDNIPNGVGDYINLNAGTHSGARYETNNDNIGNIKNGTYSIYNVWNTADIYAATKMDVIGSYNAGQVKVTVTDVISGAKETQQTFDVTATEKGKTISFSDPIMKGPKQIRMDYISSSGGYIMNYKKLQFVKVSDYSASADLTLKTLSVDGMDIPEEGITALKENGGTYTLAGNVYTAVPTVEATMSNLAGATVTPSEVNDGKVVYTITATNYQSTLTVEGLHIYTPQPNDQTVQLKYTNEGKSGEGNWSNGLYSLLSTSLDGWNNSSFKLNTTDYTLKVPSNICVKQLTFKNLANNYEGDASISAVASDGATVYLPTKRYALKDKAYDLIVNIEGHQAGKDITFNLVKAGQPTAWLELVVEENTGGNPVLSESNVVIDHNHAMVILSFDREMKDITTTFNGKPCTAEGGSTKLYFPIWDLDYNKPYTFSVAKENITDKYGNKALKDVNVQFTTDPAPTVAMARYDYVVGNAVELNAAIDALKSSNNSATAQRRTVLLKNGNYTYGTLTGNYQHNISLDKIYNVSLIGESKEGVVIEGTTDGITSSTLDLGNGTGNYLQDITIRNNYDFRAQTLKGVSVAINGGNKTILKNVALQASQDTYVTGKRTYLENCDIYGTTDFICGDGDIFFESCNLIIGNKSGSVITAPSTSTDNKWGYVFQNCVVKADENTTLVTDKSWNLGRPWQNEPRAYFLNTKMEVLCSDAGWTSMSNLPTHFYEYNSTDINGNAIDLSTRKNSPTSTNEYTPVLTDEEAKRFILQNVLVGTDSWYAKDYTGQCSAPAEIKINGTSLQWKAVSNALCYAVFKDGQYIANTIATSYDIAAPGAYTVCAANEMGGLGERSAAVDVDNLSIKVNSGGWTSFTPAIDCTMAAGAKAYIITNVTGTTATAEKVETLKAGEGYFVKGDAVSTAYNVYETNTTPDATTGNMIRGCAEATVINGSGTTKYLVGEKAGVAGLFYLGETSTTTVPAGKAYLEVEASANARMLNIFCTDDNTTTILNISADGASKRKTMVDGKVVIITKQGTYNAAGSRVNEGER